jgi:hypothetical protein
MVAMQEAGESSGMRRRTFSGSPSPITVFLGLVLVLFAVGVVVLLTKEPTPPPPKTTTPPAPNFALTDTEAITRLRALELVALEAIRNRDVSLLSQAFTAGGVAHRRADRAIAQLLRDDVRDRSRVSITTIRVRERTESSMTLMESRVLYPCFLDGKGSDVTSNSRPLEEVLRKTLVLQESEWLIDDSVVVESNTLRGVEYACP